MHLNCGVLYNYIYAAVSAANSIKCVVSFCRTNENVQRSKYLFAAAAAKKPTEKSYAAVVVAPKPKFVIRNSSSCSKLCAAATVSLSRSRSPFTFSIVSFVCVRRSVWCL